MALTGMSAEQISHLETQFLNGVPKDGGRIGNKRLRVDVLGWNEDLYLAIRERLLDKGTLILGGGRGGSVRLSVEEITPEHDHAEFRAGDEVQQSDENGSHTDAPGRADVYIKNIQSIITSIAIISGGAWAIWEYQLLRPHKSKINLSQSVVSKRLPSGHTWLQVKTIVNNVGKKNTIIKNGYTRIQQLLPLPRNIASKTGDVIFFGDKSEHYSSLILSTRKSWDIICQRRFVRTEFEVVESGEQASLHQEFFIPYFIDSVIVYTELSNEDDTNSTTPTAWHNTIVHDIQERKGSPHDKLIAGSLADRIICERSENTN